MYRWQGLTVVQAAVYSSMFSGGHWRDQMRKPSQITVDRALLLYVLYLAEPHGLLSDVKLQQLGFLCELQTFGKGFKGFHFEHGVLSGESFFGISAPAQPRFWQCAGVGFHAVWDGWE